MLHLYTILFYLLVPVILLRLLWRSLRAPAYRRRWLERFGLFPAFVVERTVWIHAVSVGEVQAAERLVKLLLESHPDLPIIITTTTPTGSDRVSTLFGSSVLHVYAPYDLPLVLNSFIRRTRPCLLVMMETEVWPNMLAVCEREGIPTILANARLSEKSAGRYAKWPRFTRDIFARIGLVAAQSKADAERFMRLGVAPDRVEVIGSIKFDSRLPASQLERSEVLRRDWGDRPVWVAASTQEGEDGAVLAAHRLICRAVPGALLVLVPRHPERFDRVYALCQREGFSCVRRSSGDPCGADMEVFLGDSMGELSMFLAAADVAFVGGSLVKHGGQNVLEPAALGKPVVFGPHMYNFASISELLLQHDAAKVVTDAEGLAAVIVQWLSDASERARVGGNGRIVVKENQGAVERLFTLIERHLTQ
ncbi:MAG: 3-deoxy-D-manno-octulosonic acid transferase [Gammaproteobacteria bacterium]|nr:3-deoxy-D-manno-octulosonic acid transferase [Gammaproteobacteria bacterium]